MSVKRQLMICEWLDQELKSLNENKCVCVDNDGNERMFTKQDYVNSFAEHIINLVNHKGFRIKNANLFKQNLCEFIYDSSYDD
jgi:hypothetical protein